MRCLNLANFQLNKEPSNDIVIRTEHFSLLDSVQNLDCGPQVERTKRTATIVETCAYNRSLTRPPHTAHTTLYAKQQNKLENLKERKMHTLARDSTGLPLYRLSAALVAMASTAVQNTTLFWRLTLEFYRERTSR